ncbi:GNAT family N-acetyltransferase [Deinococcus multiflagellatus]|uniref:GNAT family N-acetyltransferase n=1 Tax=Deinococcus multiflagellatus TaxID=1656887 RepID=A0ABW1ZLM4_9DEIO|nr:GNAT family N-acetyltransferase [Deinococcus multiflagellatus]MBZ9716032.1 GNAT family N-acetyltransferase [Deinococcus multiflagellatus]
MIEFAPVSPRTALATRTLLLAGLRERFDPLREEYLGDVPGLPDTSAAPRLLLVGTVQGQPVCCGAVSPEEGQTWRLERVSVHPDWRGRGLAQGLLAQLKAEARARGARRLVLTTRAGWTSATPLSRSKGFPPTHQDEHAYTDGSGSTALHVQKVLQ